MLSPRRLTGFVQVVRISYLRRKIDVAGAMGVVSTLALRGSLVAQLDDRLFASSERAAAAERGFGPEPDDHPDDRSRRRVDHALGRVLGRSGARSPGARRSAELQEPVRHEVTDLRQQHEGRIGRAGRQVARLGDVRRDDEPLDIVRGVITKGGFDTTRSNSSAVPCALTGSSIDPRRREGRHGLLAVQRGRRDRPQEGIDRRDSAVRPHEVRAKHVDSPAIGSPAARTDVADA